MSILKSALQLASLSILALTWPSNAQALLGAPPLFWPSILEQLQKSEVGRGTAEGLTNGPYQFQIGTGPTPYVPEYVHICPDMRQAIVRFHVDSSSEARADKLIRLVQQTRDFDIIVEHLKKRLTPGPFYQILQLMSAPHPSYFGGFLHPKDYQSVITAAILRYVMEYRSDRASLTAMTQGQPQAFPSEPLNYLRFKTPLRIYQEAMVVSGFEQILKSNVAQILVNEFAYPLSLEDSEWENVIDIALFAGGFGHCQELLNKDPAEEQ